MALKNMPPVMFCVEPGALNRHSCIKDWTWRHSNVIKDKQVASNRTDVENLSEDGYFGPSILEFEILYEQIIHLRLCTVSKRKEIINM